MKATVLFFCVLLLSGCAGVKESAKGVLGVSTKALEEKRPQALSAQINYPYRDCYEKTRRILQESGSYIYASSKEMFAVYLSGSDTTPVGVFFKEIDGSNTEVSVSSASIYAKETLAKRLFRQLDKSLHPEKYLNDEKTEEKAEPLIPIGGF